MMNIEDGELRGAVARAWKRHAPGSLPTFAATWAAAERRRAVARARHRNVAIAAALAVIVVAALSLRAPEPDVPYIEVADLLESTGWFAPSDILLPERQFDIYQELPVIIESTEPAGGTLL